MKKRTNQFEEYTAGRGGWSKWSAPRMKGYKMQCCDCDLVHEIEFQIVKFSGKPDKDGLSKCRKITNKDVQVLWRLRRSD